MRPYGTPPFSAVLLATAVLSSGLAGCAQGEIVRRSVTPRITKTAGSGAYRWDETRGWIAPEKGDWGSPEHVWNEARRAFEAGRHADALAGFLEVERMIARLPEAEKEPYRDLNYFIGECYYQLGRYEEALERFRTVYRKDLPSPERVDAAQRRVYEIGMAYLEGRVVCDLLGIIYYECRNFGVEILVGTEGGLIEERRDLPYADDALIEVARYYFEEGQYAEALPLFDRVATRRESRWSDAAEFQAALCVFLQVRGVDYDQQMLQDAEDRFNAYLEHHPRGAHVEEARAKLREISEMKGEQFLKIAKFYLREGRPLASRIYLRKVLIDHPNSRAAREAREIQARLDQAEAAQ